MADIIENQFKNQSTYPDENKGAADSSDIGGTSSSQSEGLKLTGLNDTFTASIESNTQDNKSNEQKANESAQATQKSIENNINSSSEPVKSANKIYQEAQKLLENSTKSISEAVETNNENKDKSSLLPSDVMSALKLDKLADGILKCLKNGTPVSSILKNGIDGYISEQISNLQNDSSATKQFLMKAGGKFGENLKGKVIGVLASKIYVPEEIFLAGLKKFKLIKSNINYKNKYIRKMCFEHDFAKVLAFVNEETGFRYTVENSVGMKEGIDAAKQGSWHVSKYIMGELYKEIQELQGIFPVPTLYDANQSKQEYDKLDSSIKELEAAKQIALPVPARAIQASIDELKTKQSKLFINTENEYKKDPDYSKIQKLINTGKKQLHAICQAIIVHSYSNLTVAELTKIIKKFDIHPSAFGSKDKEFGKAYIINGGNINIIAKFITPKESVIEEAKSIKSTELVKNNIKTKFINPRNNNCKKIYVYLQSTRIHGKNAMYNVPYKERMEYPIYDMFISSADSALSGFYDTGLGKRYVDTIYAIESAYYDYAKSVEDYLYVPSKTLYMSYNDFTKIPELNESDYEDSTSSTTPSNGKPGTNNSPGGKAPVKTTPAGGTTTPSKVDPSTLDRSSGKTENGITIYKPIGVQAQGIDANGNPIYGYPTDAEISKSVAEGRVGSRNESNPNGYPVDEKGNICPIIGYDQYGNAVYGSPVFYPETDPIATDANGNPVFGYDNGKPIIGYDSDNNPIYGEVNQKYIYYKWEGNHSDSEIDSMTESQVTNILKYNYDYTNTELVDMTFTEKKETLKTEYKTNNIFYGYDEKGNKVIAIDEEGRSIISYDQYGYPIYGGTLLNPNGTDLNGRIIFGFTTDGQPIYGFANKLGIIGYNSDGSPITTSKTVLIPIGKRKDGYPIYKYDTAARPVIGFDSNRNPILSYKSYSVSQINSMEESIIDSILKSCYSYTDETLSPYSITEKKQILNSKCTEGILLIPIVNYDQYGNPVFGHPLIKEINKIETITIVRRSGKKSALDYGYIPEYKDDYDLKNEKEFNELETLVYKEMNEDVGAGFLLKVVFWEK